MIFVPLPFVVAILLLVLFAFMALRDDERPVNRPFLVLVALIAVQSTLQGLRFGYGATWTSYIAAPLASVMPALIYSGAISLTRSQPSFSVRAFAPHAIAPAVVIVLFVAWPTAIDLFIILVSLIYAALLLRLLLPGADALRLAPLDGAVAAHRALLYAAFVLVFSALVDGAIFLDIAYLGGGHLPLAVSLGNLSALVFLSVAAAAASRSRTPPEDPRQSERSPAAQTPPPERDDDAATMAAVEDFMRERHLYRDADLNLDRLARKAVIPSRQISGAINRTTGKNVSQYVNDFRIAEACDRLTSDDAAVTAIMFDVGFQTKSNFNREFRRVTGMTPVEWRKSKAQSEKPA